MSETARTHFRQAQGFARAGQFDRALELLNKARLLGREDPYLLREVYAEIAAAADALGLSDQARTARDRLAELPLTMPAGDEMNRGTLASPSWRMPRMAGAGRFSAMTWFIVGGVVLFLMALLSIPVVYIGMSFLSGGGSPRTTGTSLPPVTVPVPPAPQAPTTQPIIIMLDSPATAGSESADAANATGPQAAPSLYPAGWDAERLLKDNVAMVCVIGRYEGSLNGKRGRAEIPIGTGTAFAVSTNGIMLTNRHVIDGADRSSPGGGAPPTLAAMGLPTMTLRGISYLVCFGSTPAEQFGGSVLYRSNNYDLAVIKINRQFAAPLILSHERQRQGDPIIVCGYPGAVTEALAQGNASQRSIDSLQAKWLASGRIRPLDMLPPDGFQSTVTRGIVSATERHIQNVAYIQIDAMVSPGNSGGPVLTNDNQVIGIATFVVPNSTSSSYNFALAIDQLRDELRPYLTPSPGNQGHPGGGSGGASQNNGDVDSYESVAPNVYQP